MVTETQDGLVHSRQLARRVLERVGLIGPVFRWKERQRALEVWEPFTDGLPMPPADLITAINGIAAPKWYSERGRINAQQFWAHASRQGVDLTAGINVLDLGCGCGRIARWLAPSVVEAGGRFNGTDLNPRLSEWCAANLAGHYMTNRLHPPLQLPDRSYDLVYAYSVFTHLAEATARKWLQEVARILRPSGVAILTFHDERFAARLAPAAVRKRLRDRPYVVWNNALEGSNYLSAWTTRANFAAMAEPVFEILEIIEGGTGADPEQAVAILRAR